MVFLSPNHRWQVAAICIAATTVLPVVAVLYLAAFPTENIWQHLFATVLPKYVWNTLLLLGGVGISVFVTGVATAHLVTQYEFPLRRLLEILLLLPLAMPAYLLAYLYTDLLEFSGPVQAALREFFGWQLARDYWFPEIRSLGGAVALMGLVLYPYVYLLARASFLQQSQHLLDASRLMGRSRSRAFFSVTLPIARPAIAVGVALALMEALNDFGTVDYFAVQTLTAGLYDVWLNMNNLGGAAQIATTMLAFVLILLGLEYFGRRRQRFYEPEHRSGEKPRHRLRGKKSALAFGFCALPVLFGFVIPFLVLLGYAVDNFAASQRGAFRTYAFNSLWVSGMAALLCVGCAVVVGYARRLRPSTLSAFTSRLASVGYALPGAVLAVGVIIPFAALDNYVDALARQYFGLSTGLILSGTSAALIFACVIRFLAISVGSVEANFGKIPESMDMAARTLGHTTLQTLRQFHLPLLRSGMLTAALIVFVDCMKELPATLILRPFNFETLATHVYHFASDEMLEQSALGALCIVVAGLLPIILLSRSVSANKI